MSKKAVMKKYKALSGGVICQVGSEILVVVKDHVYEWGPQEAALYLLNAPDNFKLVTSTEKETKYRKKEDF